jgi:hypothetical protein
VAKREKPGQPSKYKPDYGAMLITHMADGLSFESFGGVIGVCAKTLYNWGESHPEFLQAKKSGETLSLLYWEKVGRDGLYNEVIKTDDGTTVTRSINATIWIFNMKNRFKWRDKTEDEIREESEASSLKDLSTDELRARLAKLRGNGK